MAVGFVQQSDLVEQRPARPPNVGAVSTVGLHQGQYEAVG
jgi:hypothetical protein